MIYNVSGFLVQRSVATVQGVPYASGLGWVYLNFVYSTVCPFLPWLMGWARWCNNQIQVQVHEQMGHPVLGYT